MDEYARIQMKSLAYFITLAMLILLKNVGNMVLDILATGFLFLLYLG